MSSKDLISTIYLLQWIHCLLAVCTFFLSARENGGEFTRGSLILHLVTLPNNQTFIYLFIFMHTGFDNQLHCTCDSADFAAGNKIKILNF